MGSESRSRKKSKYLSYPYISYVNKELAGETGKNACSHDSREAVFVRVPVNGFVGSPALVKCTRKKLLRLHPKEFEYPPPDPSRVTPAEFLSDIGLLALDCSYPSGSDKIHAIEWFSYQLWSYLFRDQSSHEAYVKNASDQEEDFHDASYRGGRRRGRKRKSNQAAEVGTNGYPAAGDQTGSWRLPDLNGGQQGMNTLEQRRGRRKEEKSRAVVLTGFCVLRKCLKLIMSPPHHHHLILR